MELSALPDHIKSRILSHLLQPTPPGSYTAGARDWGRGPDGINARLRNRSITQGPVVLDEFAHRDAIQGLLAEAKRLVEAKASAARMGGAAADAKWADSQYRGDMTVFLGSPSQLEARGYPALCSFLAAMASQLQPWLEHQGYDVGGRPTFQLGCYPRGGARYVRHRDASLTCAYRTVTAICYLNPDWKAEDGGELCVYHFGTTRPMPTSQPLPAFSSEQTSHPATPQPPAASAAAPSAVRSGLEEGHAATVVPPLAGRLVVFDSRTQHEVLPSHAPRYALTIWFTRSEEARGKQGAAAPEQEAAAEGGRQAQQAPQGQEQEDLQGPMQQAMAGKGVVPPLGPVQPAQLQQPASVKGQPGLSQQGDAGWSSSSLPGAGCDRDQGPGISLPGAIFVSIAAYRDSECQWTLLDLFQKAARPDLVRAGVVWQVDWARDAHFVRIAPGGDAHMCKVRQVILNCGEATGPCKARAMAQQLWDGEEFYLQIDSHMRFVPGWDTKLLGMLRQAEQQAQHSRVILSTYPPGYEGEGEQAVLCQNPPTTVLCATHFDQDGMLRIKGRTLPSTPPAPLPALFWAAGFSFSRAELIHEVPYDPSLSFLFFGEEMFQLVRMWQRGWDVYAPCAPVAFHLWSRAHRPTFQKDAGVGSSGSEVGPGTGIPVAGARGESLPALEGAHQGAPVPGGAAVPTDSSSAAGQPWHGAGVATSAAAQREHSQRRVLWALGRVPGVRSPQHEQQESGCASGCMESAGPATARDQPGNLGLRSLAEFYRHCGVDFGRGVVGERARWGGRTPVEFQPSLQDLLAQHAQQAMRGMQDM